jgi:flagellar protein FliS
MAIVNPYQQYHNNNIQTATPERLILMLYEGALKHTKLGRLHIENCNIEKAHNSLTKVQMILEELISALNMDYDISYNLLALYEFLDERVQEANTKKDAAPIELVQRFFEELRDTWKEAMTLAKEK